MGKPKKVKCLCNRELSMELELNINGVIKSLDVAPQESLLTVLRREGYYSVKHGCESGECGACTVLVDGVARPGCVTLAAQAGGCTVTTVESLALVAQTARASSIPFRRPLSIPGRSSAVSARPACCSLPPCCSSTMLRPA